MFVSFLRKYRVAHTCSVVSHVQDLGFAYFSVKRRLSKSKLERGICISLWDLTWVWKGLSRKVLSFCSALSVWLLWGNQHRLLPFLGQVLQSLIRSYCIILNFSKIKCVSLDAECSHIGLFLPGHRTCLLNSCVPILFWLYSIWTSQLRKHQSCK